MEERLIHALFTKRTWGELVSFVKEHGMVDIGVEFYPATVEYHDVIVITYGEHKYDINRKDYTWYCVVKGLVTAATVAGIVGAGFLLAKTCLDRAEG